MESKSCRVDVVVGGSKGLGRAITEQLLEDGCRVIVMSRSIDSALRHRNNLAFIGIDLSDKPSIDTACEVLSSSWAADGDESSQSGLGRLFLCAGLGYQGELAQEPENNIHAIYQTLLEGPSYLLQNLMRSRFQPVHLVTISSTTSAKVRSNETVYGAAKAGQAQLARNFHQELIKLRPESKSTLVHPGGMNTPFWDGIDVDTSSFMQARDIASLILSEVTNQSADWLEFSIPRSSSPKPAYGPPAIEFP